MKKKWYDLVVAFCILFASLFSFDFVFNCFALISFRLAFHFVSLFSCHVSSFSSYPWCANVENALSCRGEVCQGSGTNYQYQTPDKPFAGSCS